MGERDNQQGQIPSRRKALAFMLGSIASLIVGVWLYSSHAPASLEIVAVEVGGSQQHWPLPTSLTTALWWDFAFITGYGIALLLATTVATWVFWSPGAKMIAHVGRGAAIVAVVADLVENLFLALALRGGAGRTPSVWQARFLDAAATASTIKWAALVPAALVALIGLAVASIRMVGSRRSRPELQRPTDTEALPLGSETLRLPVQIEDPPDEPAIRVPKKHRATPPQPATGAPPMTLTIDAQSERIQQDGGHKDADPTAETRWKHAYFVPGVNEEVEARTAGTEVVGFGLSGGGIRSGSVSLGVLQTLREELRGAKYLVSISGGGYTAGAFAQLLTDAGDDNVAPPGKAVHDSRQAFAAGSVEVDHIRRHSSYLASTGREMLVALGVLARGLIATLTLVFTPAIALGVVAGWLYHAIPFAVLPVLPHQQLPANAFKSAVNVTAATQAGEALMIPLPAILATAIVCTVALGLWLVQIGSYSNLSASWQDVYARASRASVFATRIAVIVSLAAIGVPVLVWASGRVVSLVDGNFRVGVSGSISTVLLTFVASLASLLWRKRKTIQDAVSGSGNAGSRAMAVPVGLLQLLLVLVSVGVLILSWLLLFGVATIATATDLAQKNPYPSLWLAALIIVAVAVVGWAFDESSLSLHPFYRRRLASAFATRAVKLPDGDGTATVAVPYHPRERTTLSTYARPATSAGDFPEFIFAASANLTGEGRTPPGLNAVSFTMSAGWVGGPDVGWVDTATLEAISPSRLRRDISVQGAVAISGAAIASAMGRFARWYQIILAISGARLGAWLPNPVFLGEMRDARDEKGDLIDWTGPGLPRVRRATYLFRELFNIHPYKERLLLVTDGGHYENLGIVELLRRRCTTIYCVDGGGDPPPTAAGLAEAMALAESELGVVIRLDDPLHAEPGAGRPLDPQAPLAVLNAALSKQPVITGTIEYPAASGLKEDCRMGKLYVARALLWPEMSYPLLSYAAQNPVFPRDSTGDQWFDDGQFTAYTQLGRELGDQVRLAQDRLARRTATPGPHAGPSSARTAGAKVRTGRWDGDPD